jgi:hypothetical protein
MSTIDLIDVNLAAVGSPAGFISDSQIGETIPVASKTKEK